MKSALVMPGLDGHAGAEETLGLLYWLVRIIRPALVVEAGTYMGHGACTMGRALKDAGVDGEVWSADTFDYGAQKSVEQNDLQDIVHLYRGDFCEMLEKLAPRRMRFAFIDSGPTDQVGTAPDIRLLHVEAGLKRMQSGGILVVDDASGQWTGVETIRMDASILMSQGRGLALYQL